MRAGSAAMSAGTPQASYLPAVFVYHIQCKSMLDTVVATPRHDMPYQCTAGHTAPSHPCPRRTTARQLLRQCLRESADGPLGCGVVQQLRLALVGSDTGGVDDHARGRAAGGAGGASGGGAAASGLGQVRQRGLWGL